MRIETQRLEMVNGPYDGKYVTVLNSTSRLPLSFDPFSNQPFADKRRSLYIRRGDHMVFAGVVTFGAGRKAGTP